MGKIGQKRTVGQSKECTGATQIAASRMSLMLVLPLVASCAAQHTKGGVDLDALARAVPMCEVVAHPTQYDGREIEIVGVYGNAPHARILFDKECEPGEIVVRIASGEESRDQDDALQRSLKHRHAFRMKTVYRGRIEANQVLQGCSKADCYELIIHDAHALAFEKVAVQ